MQSHTVGTLELREEVVICKYIFFVIYRAIKTSTVDFRASNVQTFKLQILEQVPYS